MNLSVASALSSKLGQFVEIGGISDSALPFGINHERYERMCAVTVPRKYQLSVVVSFSIIKKCITTNEN
jgi:hypothetical protein